ncbi:hypothetical protein M3J09_013067 [Ascochyta lentis]
MAPESSFQPSSTTRPPMLLLIINGHDGISCRRACQSKNRFQELLAVLSLRLPLGRSLLDGDPPRRLRKC